MTTAVSEPQSPVADAAAPVDVADPVNAAILAVSEDGLQGFQPDPFGEIASRTHIAKETVVERVQAMLDAGVIRRVRQTLLATNLARGALVAWRVREGKLHAAFDWMFKNDPFTGHVVVRSTDQKIAGAKYRLWTTLKVPVGYSMQKHCEELKRRTKADAFMLLPAKKLFALGVGHVRRKELQPGDKTDEPGRVIDVEVTPVADNEWPVLEALKREFTRDELAADPIWSPRAAEAGVSLDAFLAKANELADRGVIGRFSTFLEHYKKLKTGERVTRFNALFHWRVPEGRQLEAGREVGRFHCMTHAYWREAGDAFGNVNLMGVSHGTEKDKVLAHKAAIDAHLASLGIDVSYTNVFWGGRSEIKPSEVSPAVFRDFWQSQGVDPETLRD
ncbi:MAG: Lrp/AsnC family transcriptional regulator [Planctomycetota bacterium]